MQAMFGTHAPPLETVFDGLAEYLDDHMSREVLMSLIK